MGNLNPGQLIGVRVGPVIHLGIVSDRYVDGLPMVISNSLRSGCVAEEPFAVFKGGWEFIPVAQPANLPTWYVLSRARQMLGTRWNLISWNCEHFAYWVFGHESESPQLKQAGVMLGIAILLARFA